MSGGWTPSVHLFSQSRGKLDSTKRARPSCPSRLGRAERRRVPAAASTATQQVLNDGAQAGAEAALAARHSRSRRPEYRVQAREFSMHGLPGVAAAGQSPAAVTAFVDFQNDVTAKDLALAMREGFESIEHVKRYTTTGMATDQGKTSNMNALAIVAGRAGPADPAGRAHHVPHALHAGHVRHLRRLRSAATCSTRCARRRRTTGRSRRARCSRTSASGSARGTSRAPARTCTRRSTANAWRCARGVGMFDASTLGKIEVVGPGCGDVPQSRMYVNAFVDARGRPLPLRHHAARRRLRLRRRRHRAPRRGPLPRHHHHRRRGARVRA